MIKHHSALKIIIYSIWALLFCLPAGSVSGSNISISPFAGILAEQNDNLFNDVENKTEDQLINVSSGLELKTETGRWSSSLTAGIIAKEYKDNSNFDNVDTLINGNLKSRITERLTVSIDGGFTADSRNDRDFDETGLTDGDESVKTTKVIRKDIEAGSSASYDISQITTGTVSYELKINEFDDREFTDYTSHKIFLKWNRALYKPFSNPEFFIQSELYWYDGYENPENDPVYGDDYEKEINLKSISLATGTTADITENLNFSLIAGGRYNESGSESKVEGLLIDEEDDKGWGPTGEFKLAYTGETGVSMASLRHNLIPRTGSNGFVKNTAARCSYNHKFSDNFRATISTGFYLNKSYGTLDTDKINRQSVRIQSGLSYLPTAMFSIECRYYYRLIRDRKEDTEAQQNIIQIGISFRYPDNR